MDELDQVQSTEVDQTQQDTTQDAPSIPELESLERFKFAGREMTAKELQSSIMFQSDYTRKTQALAEDRRFSEALPHDLKKLRGDPSLADAFRKTYPEKYHAYLDALGIETKPREQSQGSQNSSPEYQQLLSRFERIEQGLQTQKVEAVGAQIDSIVERLGPKYPMADDELVLAKASVLLDQRIKEQGEEARLSEKDFEALFKQAHEKGLKRSNGHQSTQVRTQKQASLRGRDVGSGGAVPGQAPVKPKNIREASDQALKEMLTQ